jgi:microcystin synthetase protein McyJ
MSINKKNYKKSTEKFFAHGVENWDDYHNNYLNFGLWENGIKTYIDASHNLLTRVGKKIGLNSRSSLLDVACGMGSQDRFFIKQFNCKFIEAVDLTKKHIDIAVSKLRDSDYKNRIRYWIGNACHLKFKDSSFTHVTGIEGPVNFCTREDFLKEAYRVLKPNGKIGMSDFYLVRMPRLRWKVLFMKFFAKQWHIPWENVYGLKIYKKKLEDIGFVDIDLEAVGDKVIPGYYFDQRKRSVINKLKKIRGRYYTWLGMLLDWFTYRLYKRGIIGYVLVSATKPKANS